MTSDLGDFIRQQREITRLSVRRLAELAEVSNPYLSQIERGLRKPSAEILQQIAKALRISAEQLYVRAGILDADQLEDLAVPDAIQRDPRLTPEQKRSLLTVYESFVDHA
jgi:transcriptional regulator with XRE-family HTH domain